MTSHAKIEANRRNARKSTGPKTEQGKEHIRSNALKWGLHVRERLLETEDTALFVALSVDLHAEFCPEDVFQRHLVDQIVWDMWRLQRLDRAEFAVLDNAAATRYKQARESLTPEAVKLLDLLFDPNRANTSGQTSPDSSSEGQLWLETTGKHGTRYKVPVPREYDAEFVRALQGKIDRTESLGNAILDAVADERQIFERLNRLRQGITKNIRNHRQTLFEIQKRKDKNRAD